MSSQPTSTTEPLSSFEKDILEGLSSSPKRLSSKYFYDDEGSRLFQAIMHLPEYYLTRSEFEIFESHKQNLYQDFSKGIDTFEVVELGAGDGLKTEVLLSHFIEQNKKFTYLPVDISSEALLQLQKRFEKNIPSLSFKGLEGDYFEALASLKKDSSSENTRRIVLFLGSNIGNFGQENSLSFLQKLHQNLQKDDMVLLGFDLKKHPKVIQAAYDDAQGITKAFNFNLLKRINRELEANFQLNNFDFYSTYVPETGEVRSYIVSNAKQDVFLSKLKQTISFDWGETIHTEISRKYSFEDMQELTSEAGFEVIETYTDCKGYFMSMLLSVK